MLPLTKDMRRKLLRNGEVNAARQAADQDPLDHKPAVKLFTPDANATWLLTELDPGDPDLAFGLCDLGLGCPEIGYVRLSELSEIRGPLGLPVERDRHFSADKGLLAYAAEAVALGCIRA